MRVVNTAPLEPPDSSDTGHLPRSVIVAFRVLETVAELQPVGVSSIARELDLPKSTVQRSLRVLEALQYTYGSGDPTRWSLTLRPFQLASRARVMDIRVVALSEMTALSESTRESVQLTVREGSGLIVLEKIDSPQAVRSHVSRGDRLQLHASATGKAFLANETPEFVDRVLAEPLKRLTESTIVDPDSMRTELRRIRAQGYAFNDAENRADVRAVGAVIRDAAEGPVAGLSISAPKHRLPLRLVPEYATAVVSAAERISARLGWHDR